MKLFNTLATLTLLASCSQSRFNYLQLQIPSWLRIPTTSKLPLFIHDLRHHWIEENIAWLERRPNPTNDLCVASSALRNGEIEGRSVPADLFNHVHIDNNRAGINRQGWTNMRDRLKEISECPVALQQVTYLYIDVYVNDNGPMDPGEESIQLMADVLSAMSVLKRVRWGIPAQANEFFDEVFARRGLQLPSVTHLIVGAFAQHMVSICSNLERLEGGAYEHHWSWNHGSWDREKNPAKLLLQAASRVPSITSLSFQDRQQNWDRQLVRDVLQAVPNLSNLSMLGEIRDGRYGGGPMISPFLDEENPPYLKSLLHELKSATHLSHLRLPEASGLVLGFDGGAWCGNAYFGVEGRKYGRQVSRQRAETTEEAAKIAFEVLPYLERLSVGGTSPVNVIRDEEGNVVELKWAWTGRMREYLYEIWPEPKKGSREYEF